MLLLFVVVVGAGSYFWYANEQEKDAARLELRQKDNKAWEVTTELDTVDAYEDYLRQSFASVDRKAKAGDRIKGIKEAARLKQVDDTSWQRAERLGTVRGYEAYLEEEFATAERKSEAQTQIKLLQAEADRQEEAAKLAREKAAADRKARTTVGDVFRGTPSPRGEVSGATIIIPSSLATRCAVPLVMKLSSVQVSPESQNSAGMRVFRLSGR